MNVIGLSGRHLDAFELRRYISAIMIIFEPRTRTSDRGTVEVRARVESRVPPRDGSSDLVFEYALHRRTGSRPGPTGSSRRWSCAP